MNELIDGNEREITVTYTVSASHGDHESRDFADVADAAKAFHEIAANDRPVAIRVEHGPHTGPGGSGQIVGDTTGSGKLGEMEYGKYSSMHDPDFDTVYRRIAGEGERVSSAFIKQIEKAASKDDGPDEQRAAMGIEARQIAYSNAQTNTGNIVDAKTARTWAELDLREFRKLSDPSRIEDAALFMQANRESIRAYGAALEERAPEVAALMEATQAEQDHRVSLKEVGKARDAELMANRDADAFDIPRHEGAEVVAKVEKTPAEAMQSIRDRALSMSGAGQDIEGLSADAAARLARDDQADYARLDLHQKSEAADIISDHYRNRSYSMEFARNNPDAAQDIVLAISKQAEAEAAIQRSQAQAQQDAADYGRPDAPPELIEQIAANFGNSDYQTEFARLNPDVAERVTAMREATFLKSVEKEFGPLDAKAPTEALPVMDIDPRARAAMEKNRAREMAAVREAMGVEDTAISGDASAKAKTPAVDKQVAELDARMGQSKLEELGWRDREDITDVMRDLEKLAAKDWQVAAGLWDKYRPNDIDKPIFIDGDDVKDKTAAKTNTRDDARVDDSGKDDKADFVTPELLRKRFLQAENKFYYRDDENKLAFEDKGKRLATEHNDPEIARSMVELAEAKGWSTIKLKGTDEFKREVWLQASLKGMDVQGFKPRDVDLARLEDMRKESGRDEDRGRNTIDQVPERIRTGNKSERASADRAEAVDKAAVVDESTRTLSRREITALETIKSVMRAKGEPETVVDKVVEAAAERFQTNRVYVGKIIDHGKAPYENNPENERSYYVKLQTENGEKVVWGVDLERATGEGKAQIGDDVALAYQGKQPVTVQVKERDEKGNVTGVSEITTNRNTWDVRRLETVRAEVVEKLAEASRKPEVQPLIKVYDRDAQRNQERPEIVREPASKETERARGARG